MRPFRAARWGDAVEDRSGDGLNIDGGQVGSPRSASPKKRRAGTCLRPVVADAALSCGSPVGEHLLGRVVGEDGKDYSGSQ